MRLTSKCEASERQQTQRIDLCLQLVRLFDFYKVHLYVVIKLTEEERSLFSNRWLICLIRNPTCNILTLVLVMHLSFLLLGIASLLFLKMKNWWNIDNKMSHQYVFSSWDIKGFFQQSKTSTVNFYWGDYMSPPYNRGWVFILLSFTMSIFTFRSAFSCPILSHSHILITYSTAYCIVLHILSLFFVVHAFFWEHLLLLFMKTTVRIKEEMPLSRVNLLHQHSIII